MIKLHLKYGDSSIKCNEMKWWECFINKINLNKQDLCLKSQALLQEIHMCRYESSDDIGGWLNT